MLISSQQSIFVPERAMMDKVLAINEIIDFAVRYKKECGLIKVDFVTTYDCVSWEYLRYMLGRMNFDLWWLRLMDILVFSSSFISFIQWHPLNGL